MAKKELFLCDAMSAVGHACLNMIPKNYRVHAWTNRVSSWTPTLPSNVELSSVSLDALSLLPAEARKANDVVFVADAFFHYEDDSWLNTWSDVVKRSYDACDDDITSAFIFVSTASFYEESRMPVTEFSAVKPASYAEYVAYETEKYLLSASANRRLKPVILRIATPYGPRCPSLPYLIFQQIAAIATLRSAIPRFYKGPRCPLVHVDDVARAIFYLMQKPHMDEQLFNLADDDCMRVGELVAIAGKAMKMPEDTNLVLPHLSALPLVLKTFMRLNILSALDGIPRQMWKRVCYCYGLDETPSPKLEDFITASAWPRINTDRIKNCGFELEHPSFKLAAEALCTALREDHWIPDLTKAPCRSTALFNRVYFQQMWRGFIVDQAAPNATMNLLMTLDNDMPIWATHSFSNAPLRGTLTVGERLPVNVEGARTVKHLMDVCSLAKASFKVTLDGRELTFRPDVSGMSFFAPYQKFSLIDENDRVRFTGKLTLDITPATMTASVKTMKFGV